MRFLQGWAIGSLAETVTSQNRNGESVRHPILAKNARLGHPSVVMRIEKIKGYLPVGRRERSEG